MNNIIIMNGIVLIYVFKKNSMLTNFTIVNSISIIISMINGTSVMCIDRISIISNIIHYVVLALFVLL